MATHFHSDKAFMAGHFHIIHLTANKFFNMPPISHHGRVTWKRRETFIEFFFFIHLVIIIYFMIFYYLTRLMDSLGLVDLLEPSRLLTHNLQSCSSRRYRKEGRVNTSPCSSISDQVGHSMPKDCGITNLISPCLCSLWLAPQTLVSVNILTLER